MRKFLLVLLIGSFFFSSCKKDEAEPTYLKTFSFDIKNHDLTFGFKRVHFLTDSVYFQFATVTNYDCDQYRINSGIQHEGSSFLMLLGNIYLDGSQCIYGSFPATATYKSEALPEGLYKLSVKKNGVNFDGELRVTADEYSFNWTHDDDCMRITTKTFPR